jgi:hypothetical protein
MRVDQDDGDGRPLRQGDGDEDEAMDSSNGGGAHNRCKVVVKCYYIELAAQRQDNQRQVHA